MKDMKLVYIASPYAGDIEYNTRKAIEYCRYAVGHGVTCWRPLVVPKVLSELNRGTEMGIYGLALIAKCSELWVFGNKITTGMHREILQADRFGIVVKYLGELEMTDYPKPIQQEPEETPSFGTHMV